MGEPDHIFVKPLPNLAYGGNPTAFHFTYIKPVEYENVVRKFYPEDKGPISNVDPIGCSPVIISKALVLAAVRICTQGWIELAWLLALSYGC